MKPRKRLVMVIKQSKRVLTLEFTDFLTLKLFCLD